MIDVEGLRGAYDKVKLFPENRPSGLMELLELRNLVPETASEIERLRAVNADLVAALEGMLLEWGKWYGSPIAKAGNKRVNAALAAITKAMESNQ